MVNKCDLAAAVGADLRVMERDARRMREGGPVVFAEIGGKGGARGRGVGDLVGLVVSAWKGSGAQGCGVGREKEVGRGSG